MRHRHRARGREGREAREYGFGGVPRTKVEYSFFKNLVTL